MSAASSGETERDLELGDEVELRDVPIDEEGLRATVEQDDTRTLNTVEEAVGAFEDYLDAKENQMLVMEEEESGDAAEDEYEDDTEYEDGGDRDDDDRDDDEDDEYGNEDDEYEDEDEQESEDD